MREVNVTTQKILKQILNYTSSTCVQSFKFKVLTAVVTHLEDALYLSCLTRQVSFLPYFPAMESGHRMIPKAIFSLPSYSHFIAGSVNIVR